MFPPSRRSPRTSPTVPEPAPHAPGTTHRRATLSPVIELVSWRKPVSATVSIPTILRTHTGGEKQVKADGSTLQEVIADLEANHPGIKDRLGTDGALHLFVNVYVNHGSPRSPGGLAAQAPDGAPVTTLPAVAGGAR